MDVLALMFVDDGSSHGDVHLHLGDVVLRADSYYLALDAGVLPRREDAGKVRLVLVRLLEQWRDDVRDLAPGGTTHLPYGFHDQGSEWLEVTAADDDTLTVRPVLSHLAGWAVTPSSYAEARERIGVTTPVSTTLAPLRTTRTDTLAAITRNLPEPP